MQHHGQHYKVDAIHLSEPSPQRTPVLYQAGASERGRAFAARHAECIFVNGQFRHNVRDIVADIRARAKALGRDPYDIKFFVGATVVVAPTDAEAAGQAGRIPRIRQLGGRAGALLGLGRRRLLPLRPRRADPLRQDQRAALQPGSDHRAQPRHRMDAAQADADDGAGQPPGADRRLAQRVADELQAWVDEADVDGFNLSRTVIPECVEDFVALVVPELQSRGVMKRGYAAGHAAREAVRRGGPAAGTAIQPRAIAAEFSSDL